SGRVVVGTREELAAIRVALAGRSLLRDPAEVDRVKLRYRSRPVACRLDAARGEALLSEPVDGIAPGQTACFMRGDTVLGWATIAAARPTSAAAAPLPIDQEVPCPVTV
ncbi:MAG: tRNA-uridine 2-sulfurtransferase, partial [Thermoleophilaceae bacterium]|nr:tRNA-uridine 2-sulfurtransferase [Thermoleophilaceae bacterium]